MAKAVTSDRVYYRGQYFTKGDIVSVEDVEDGSVYYAQLRGFLTDQYCEKSGVITWLLPTVNSPPAEDSFDPSTYLIGPEMADRKLMLDSLNDALSLNFMFINMYSRHFIMLQSCS